MEMKNTINKTINFIIPVINDLRVIDCIKSIRRFDDCKSCKILLMAGNSNKNFFLKVAPFLNKGDILDRTPDTNLFEAFNNGLKLLDEGIVGWLGADDFLSPDLSASEILINFTDNIDAVVYSTAYFNGNRITRILKSNFSNKFYLNWGFHNPHFSTFLTKDLATSNFFKMHENSKNQFSDIQYFYEILKDAKIKVDPKIAVYMSEGGVGSADFSSVWVNLKGRYNLFRETYWPFRSILMVLVNYCWKSFSKFWHICITKKVKTFKNSLKNLPDLKVSIITATYNRENTIVRAIRSIKSQTYNNLQVIVVDGESKDKTVSRVRPFLDERDTMISESDHGLYHALNKGLDFADGDIIAFLHSDDLYFDNNVITDVVRVFSDESIDVVYGDACFFSGNNIKKINRKYKSDILSKKNLAWGKMPAHPSMFIRKQIYKEVGYFQTNYKIAGDYEFLCRMVNNRKINSIHLSRPLLLMQKGGISTSGLKNTILLNKEVYRAIRQNQIYTNIFMLLSRYPSKILQFFKI